MSANLSHYLSSPLRTPTLQDVNGAKRMGLCLDALKWRKECMAGHVIRRSTTLQIKLNYLRDGHQT